MPIPTIGADLARSCHSLRGVIPPTGASEEFPMRQFHLSLGLKRLKKHNGSAFDHH